MKKPVPSIRSQAAWTGSRRNPELQLVHGDESAAAAPAPRGAMVRRARRRLAAGYYEQPDVQRSLVETLWDEFFSR